MREMTSRANKLADRSEDGTSLHVECSPDGDVLLLIKSPHYPVPAVFGFTPMDAHRFAKTVMEAAADAEAMLSKVVT